MASTNGTPATNALDEISAKAPPGTVLPPRNVREIVERTAGYVVRNGANFEDKVRQMQGDTGKMSFLNPEDEYRTYYEWRLSEISAGRGTSQSAGRKEGEVSFAGREERKGPEMPPEFVFSARMPNISALDLEVVKLTAVFVAKNGRGWMTGLSQREAGNYQFDFLRPQHSLYQFFSRLVDQYTELLQGGSVDGGRPQKKRIVELEGNVKDRLGVLERARKRAEWVKYQEAQKVEAEEKTEKEMIAYQQVDWHDFVVVETVVFDEGDDERQLPAPTTLNDIQSRSLEQKANWGNDPGRRIEEAMPTFDDQHLFNDTHPTQPQTYTPTPQPTYQPPSPAPQPSAERARARAAQETAARPTNTNAPIKIVHNYTPAALAAARQKGPATSICPNCKQAIANDEMAQHLKIEMLHPEWRDQWRVSQQRSEMTNLSTADVAGNLKRLASQRGDVFEERQGGGKRVEMDVGKVAEEQARVIVGASTGAGGDGAGGEGRGRDVQEQIRLIYERAQRGG